MNRATDERSATFTARDIRIGTPRVIELSGPGNRFAPPGSIWVLVAPRDSAVLGQIEQAVAQSDEQAQERTIRQMIRDFSETVSRSARLYDRVSDIPVLGEVRYKSKSLRRGMFIAPGYEVAFSILPYNGADLQAEGFQFVEYYDPLARDQLEALVVVSKPALTDLENEILARVDPEWDQVNIAELAGDWTDVVYEVADFVADVVDAAEAVYDYLNDIIGLVIEGRDEEVLLDQVFDELDPRASAAVLLQVRTQLLEELRAKDAAGAARTVLRARSRIAGLAEKRIF